jgi:hypothetical protein
VGARTVAMMIDQAMLHARAREGQGAVGRSTVFVKSLVDQAVTKSTRKFKIALVLALLVLLGGGAAATYVIMTQSGLEADERDRLVKEIATLARQSEQREVQKERAELAKERQEMQKRISDLTKQLGRMQSGGPGADIAQKNHYAVYLIVAKYGGQASPFCTSRPRPPRRPSPRASSAAS